MITAGNVAVDRVGKVRWIDALDLFAYWRRSPPVHEMVAAYLGVKPAPASQPVSADDPSGIGALIAQFPNGFVPASR